MRHLLFVIVFILNVYQSFTVNDKRHIRTPSSIRPSSMASTTSTAFSNPFRRGSFGAATLIGTVTPLTEMSTDDLRFFGGDRASIDTNLFANIDAQTTLANHYQLIRSRIQSNINQYPVNIFSNDSLSLDAKSVLTRIILMRDFLRVLLSGIQLVKPIHGGRHLSDAEEHVRVDYSLQASTIFGSTLDKMVRELVRHQPPRVRFVHFRGSPPDRMALAISPRPPMMLEDGSSPAHSKSSKWKTILRKSDEPIPRQTFYRELPDEIPSIIALSNLHIANRIVSFGAELFRQFRSILGANNSESMTHNEWYSLENKYRATQDLQKRIATLVKQVKVSNAAKRKAPIGFFEKPLTWDNFNAYPHNAVQLSVYTNAFNVLNSLLGIAKYV